MEVFSPSSFKLVPYGKQVSRGSGVRCFEADQGHIGLQGSTSCMATSVQPHSAATRQLLPVSPRESMEMHCCMALLAS